MLQILSSATIMMIMLAIGAPIAGSPHPAATKVPPTDVPMITLGDPRNRPETTRITAGPVTEGLRLSLTPGFYDSGDGASFPCVSLAE